MRQRVLAGGFLATVALAVAGCGGARHAGLSTFAGHWWGHTRGLDISRDGRGREYLAVAGFARPLVIRFRIVRVYGTEGDAVARVHVTAVGGPPRILALVHRPHLRADDAGTLLLKHGIVTDGLTSDEFCAPHVDKCGL